MKKVIFLVATLKIGGAEMLVKDIAINLDKELYDVEIIVLDRKVDSIIEEEILENGIKVKYLNCHRKNILKRIYIIYKELIKSKADVLHINHNIMVSVFLPLLFLRKLNKTIYTIHTLPHIDAPSYVKLVNLLAIKLGKTKFVAINKECYDQSIKYYMDKNITLIENGIDLRKFYQSGSEKKSIKNIIHIGRFCEAKNHKFLIEVFYELLKRYNDLNLTLLGDGSLKNEIEDRVIELGISDNVTFCGEVKDVDRYLRESDIMIFPSIYEGSPLSVIQAIAVGLPIISSNKGGLPAIIQNGVNGYVNELDIDKFVNKTVELIENNNLYNDISKNNIDKRNDYSILKTVKLYEKLYEEV